MHNHKQTVTNTLAHRFDIDHHEVKRESHFVEDFNATSADLTDIISHIETELGIEIPLEEQQAIETVGDLYDIIEDLAVEL